jgi:hypothetical protein
MTIENGIPRLGLLEHAQRQRLQSRYFSSLSPARIGLLAAVMALAELSAPAPAHASDPSCSANTGCPKDSIQSLLPFAPGVSASFDPSSVLVGVGSELTITLSNSNPVDDITGVLLADAYPAGLFNVDVTPVVSDTCNFVEDVPPGGTVANLSGGTIPANDACTIVLAVVGKSPVNIDNHTGAVSSANAPDGPDTDAVLAVGLTAPTVTTSFVPANVAVGGTSQLTITLANPNPSGGDITGVHFTDTYPTPANMANGAADVVVDNTCGVLDAPANGGSLSLSGGAIVAGDSCRIVVNVVGTATGSVDNHTGPVGSDNAQDGADASATLTISHFPLLIAPTVTKVFSPDTVGPGGVSQMTITLTNPNPPGANRTINGAQVNDLYPSGITNVSGNPVSSDSCGFAEDVPGDGAWAKLANGTIPAGNSCSIVINVLSTATATNSTGTILSGNAQPGVSADATLTFNPAAPVVTCILPTQVNVVGDQIALDLSLLFAPPAGQSLVFSTLNVPASLVVAGSMLTGTLQDSDALGSPYLSGTLIATTNPGGASAQESVIFEVLPTGEKILLRDGFDGPSCQ